MRLRHPACSSLDGRLSAIRASHSPALIAPSGWWSAFWACDGRCWTSSSRAGQDVASGHSGRVSAAFVAARPAAVARCSPKGRCSGMQMKGRLAARTAATRPSPAAPTTISARAISRSSQARTLRPGCHRTGCSWPWTRNSGSSLPFPGYLGHIVVAQRGRSQELFEARLREMGLSRRIQLQSPHFMSVPLLVAGSDRQYRPGSRRRHFRDYGASQGDRAAIAVADHQHPAVLAPPRAGRSFGAGVAQIDRRAASGPRPVSNRLTTPAG